MTERCRVVVAATLAILAAAALSEPQARRRDRDASEPAAAAPVSDTAAKTAALPVRPAAPATFLDTLNTGREARLTAADLPRRDSAAAPPPAARTGASVPTAPLPSPTAPATGRETYRIQCAAAGQSAALDGRRAALQAKVSWPVRIVNVPPYWKLFVGEFGTRDEAEKALFDVKGLGYPDAWLARDTLR